MVRVALPLGPTRAMELILDLSKGSTPIKCTCKEKKREGARVRGKKREEEERKKKTGKERQEDKREGKGRKGRREGRSKERVRGEEERIRTGVHPVYIAYTKCACNI